MLRSSTCQEEYSLHTEGAGSPLPDAIGRFRALQQIGAGTLGPVFRAYEPERDRSVAIKLFRLNLVPVQVHQLVDELERLVAVGLRHPGLSVPLAAGADPSGAYLVQEFVPAESLDTRMRNQRALPPGDVVRLIAQLADALDAAADVGVSGGALHPRDVLLASDDVFSLGNEPRLTGLGVVRALERAGIQPPVRRPYTAPERLTGAAWDRRADVFSLGAIAYELLWGRRITGPGGAAADALTDLPGTNLDLLRAAFARALAEDPADRSASAREFADAVKAGIQPRSTGHVPAPSLETIGDFEIHTESEPSAWSGEPARDGAPSTASVAAEGQAVDPTHPARDPWNLDEHLDHPTETGGGQPDDLMGVTSDHEIEPTLVESRPRQDTHPRRLLDLDLDRPESRDPQPSGGASGHSRRAGLIPSVVVPPPLEPTSPSGTEADGIPALDRTRSAIWPLALALLVGLALGFASGYGVGSRERTAVGQGPSSGMAGAAGSGHERAEGAVDGQIGPPGAIGTMPRSSSKSTAPTTPPGAPVSGRSTPAPAPSRSGPSPAGPESTPPATVAKSPAHGSPAPATLGRLFVRSVPPGARIFVDGREHGRAPALIRDLARGEHRVRLVREGYETDERRVSVTASASAQPLVVKLNRTRPPEPKVPDAPRSQPARPGAQVAAIGSLTVESRPVGVRVFIDGKPVGVTPLVVPQIAAGEHVVRLEQSGYREWQSSIHIVPGERNRVTGSLEEK